MSPITSKLKDNFQFVLLVSCFVGHPVYKLTDCYFIYSETRNKEYIERIHQMSYSSLSDNGMLQILSFLIK